MTKQNHIAIYSLILLVVALFSILTIQEAGISGKAYDTPIQIYGEITPALPDGAELTLKVNNLEIASTQIKDGKYGYESKVYLSDRYVKGDIVNVYIEGIEIAEASYFSSMPKDFIVPVSKRAEVSNKIASAINCISDWDCSDWSDCNNNLKSRNCFDKSYCRIQTSQPAESIECETQIVIESPEEIIKKQIPWNYIISGIVILIIFVSLILYDIHILSKSKKEPKKKVKKKTTKKKNKEKMKLHIYLFRHAQTYYNKKHYFCGWKDSKLTPFGIKQAKKIAKKLKTKKIDVAYHSHLSRSKDTLKEVLKFHPECNEIIKDDRIIERSYGKLQGHSHKTFVEQEGEEDYEVLLHEHKIHHLHGKEREEFEEAVGKAELQVIRRNYTAWPPKGESVKMVEQRVKPFIKDLLKKMKKEKVNVAISAHGNSMRPLRRYFEKLTIEEMMELENPWDDYFHYTIEVK